MSSFCVILRHNSPIRAAAKASHTVLDSQLNANYDNNDDGHGNDDASYLNAPHQHMRIRGGEELPVDQAGDQNESHGHSAEDQAIPSVGKKYNLVDDESQKLKL